MNRVEKVREYVDTVLLNMSVLQKEDVVICICMVFHKLVQ